MTDPEFDLTLLERLCDAPGVSGREDAVRRLVRAELADLADETSVDPMGNLVAVRRGSGGPRVMLAAHMDEVGFLVKHVDRDGFLWIHPVGGIFTKFLGAQRVLVHPTAGGDPVPGVLYDTADLGMPNEEVKVPKVEGFFVDVGPDQLGRVGVGDAVTMDRGLRRSGDRVVAKALDDRIGLFVIVEVLRRLPRVTAEVIVVGSVQEEIGLRGATVAAHRIAKDAAVAIDTTHARDLPTVEASKAIARLGGGVSIKVMDRGQITNARLVAFARGVAEGRGIPHQLEVGLPGGTDADAIEISGDGTPSIALSIPCRYPHTASETCDLRDVRATVSLLEAFLEELTPAALERD
ncbi:MAG: M42 family metallopeptidase [Candidatus Velamenicoccus archaeovorus]